MLNGTAKGMMEQHATVGQGPAIARTPMYVPKTSPHLNITSNYVNQANRATLFSSKAQKAQVEIEHFGTATCRR